VVKKFVETFRAEVSEGTGHVKECIWMPVSRHLTDSRRGRSSSQRVSSCKTVAKNEEGAVADSTATEQEAGAESAATAVEQKGTTTEQQAPREREQYKSRLQVGT
jgi:hypothetical protein